mgnify:CR=1 FL=1
MSSVARASTAVLKNPRVAGALSSLMPQAKSIGGYVSRNMGRVQPVIGAVANIGSGPVGMAKGALDSWMWGSAIQSGMGKMRGPMLNRLAQAGVNPNVAQSLYRIGLPIAGTVATQALAAQPGGVLGGGNRGGYGGYAGYGPAGYGGAGGGGMGIPGAGIVGGIGRGIRGVGQGAVGLLGYNHVTGEPMYGTPLPPGTGTYGNIAPAGGNPLGVVSPGGVSGARRLEGMKSAELTRDMMNVILPTERKYSEQAKRDEFARAIAAAGIRENIATNASMRRRAQEAAFNMGQSAAQGASNALAAQFQYT